ncbi:hypothetical protein V2J09_002268 [Rumex salicifolius]
MLKPNGSNPTMNIVAALVLITLPLILASPSSSSITPYQRLHRRDPLGHFEFYNGGYDIRDKHYWASAAFTGVHGYAVAAVWVACGLGFGLLFITKSVTSNTTNSNVSQHSDSSYFFLIMLILVFTLLAITTTSFVLATNKQSLHESKAMEREVLGAGADARRGIHRVKRAIKDIQAYLCPYDSKTCALLNTTTYQLGDGSLAIKQFMHKNGHFIDTAISLLLIFICWILTTTCWVLTGVNFFLHNFAEDTCAALQSFLVNPNNSSLSSLLPCENLLKSQHILIQIGQIVYDFVTEMNSRIVELPKELGLYESSKYSDLIGSPKICDPFSGPPNYTYVQGKCPDHTISIAQLPHILEKFTCSNNGSSLISGCLPESYYSIAYAYIRSIQDLIGAYPDLDGLIHCSFVKFRLSDAESRHCRAFKVSTKRLWISMLCLSTAMAALVLLWIAKAFLDRGRSYSLYSITPNRTQL